MDDQLVVFAENAIREHLAEHPESSDTLEGVHLWWIRWPGLTESSMVTQVALDRLATAGEVESLTIGNRILWRRRRGPPPVA